MLINYLVNKTSIERSKIFAFIQNNKQSCLSDLNSEEQRDEYVKLSGAVIKNFYSNKFFSNCLKDVKKVENGLRRFIDEMHQYQSKCCQENLQHPNLMLDSAKQIERKEKILGLLGKYSQDLDLFKTTGNKLLTDDSLDPHQKHILNSILSDTISKKLEIVKTKLKQANSSDQNNFKKVINLLTELCSDASNLSEQLYSYIKETEHEINKNNEYKKDLGGSLYDFGNRLNKLYNMKALMLAHEKSKYTFFADMLSVATQKR